MRQGHDRLVARALSWLVNSRRCVVAVSEITTASRETPDALGWIHAEKTVLVECKAGRGDFLRDRRKHVRRLPTKGMGNLRYYLSWPQVIAVDDLPPAWGLLWLGRRLEVKRHASYVEAERESEISVLLSVIRRKPGKLGDREISLSARWYQWGNKCRARVVVPPTGGERP